MPEVMYMLFDRHMEPCCAWCRSGVRISETEVACLKRGVVSSAGACRRFKYDPLKREPPVPAAIDGSKFSGEDFSIEP